MKDYTTYGTFQWILNTPLTYVFFCLYFIVFSYIVSIDGIKNEEIIGWIFLVTLLSLPILIPFSLAIGALIAFIVRKMQLCRNKQGIWLSLLVTFAVYSMAELVFMMSIDILNGRPSHSWEGFSDMFFIFFLPISLCGCLTSWIFSCFLPKEIIVNISEE